MRRSSRVEGLVLCALCCSFGDLHPGRRALDWVSGLPAAGGRALFAVINNLLGATAGRTVETSPTGCWRDGNKSKGECGRRRSGNDDGLAECSVDRVVAEATRCSGFAADALGGEPCR